MRWPAAIVALAVGALGHTSPVLAQTLGRIGTTVYPVTLEGTEYILADIPRIEAMVGGTGRLTGSLDLGITWGVKGGTSLDPFLGNTLRWHPFKAVSVFVHGRAGTLLLNNVTVLGSTGLEIEIPIGGGRKLLLGGEYFNRLVTKVGGFLDGPKWYVSGDGLGVRVGFGFSPGPNASGL
jgi:hypothetical protein